MKWKETTRAASVNLASVVMSPTFILSVLLFFGVLFAEVIQMALIRDTLASDMGDAYFFNISIHFGYYIYAAPLLCSLATGGLFVNDSEAGFYRLRLMRSGRGGYRHGLWLGATVGGGLALFLGALLFALSCALLFGPHYPATSIATADGWLPVLEGLSGNWRYMLLNALLAFVFGMVWSGVGLTFTVLSPNRYVGVLAPFILCFCLALLLPPALQPLEMLVQGRWESFSLPMLFLYQGVLYLLALLWFSFAYDRRITHGQG
ncbi:hypothetical protein FACS1894196_3280 [Clostridia bacterium]|nr:hypothetical protein FACS1894196_3280 [Clostridia bacterium]